MKEDEFELILPSPFSVSRLNLSKFLGLSLFFASVDPFCVTWSPSLASKTPPIQVFDCEGLVESRKGIGQT